MQIKVDHDVEKFIASLSASTIAKVLRTIDLLETFGHALRLPHCRPIAKGLFELRTRGRQEVRILYTFHDGSIFLLYGFVKKSAKTPLRDIQKGLDKMNALT